MKKTVFFLILGALIGLAHSANATPTKVADLYNSCIENSSAAQESAECAALRENINEAIRDCMYPAGVQTAKAKSSHGYKAQYLVCNASVRAQFGTVGD